jgi:hypothetical protein
MEAAQDAETPHDERPSPPHASLRWCLAPWMCGLLALFANFGSRLIIIPLNRMVELTICRDYYAHHNPDLIGPGSDVPELYCKEKPIQIKVAYLIGLITFLGLFIGMSAPWPRAISTDSVQKSSSPFLSATPRIAMGASSSSCLTTLPYCWLSPGLCLSVNLRCLHSCDFAKYVPTKLSQSKQSLSRPFFIYSEETSMSQQQTYMPSLPT